MVGKRFAAQHDGPVPFSKSQPPEAPRSRGLIPLKPVENLADTLEQLELAGGNIETFLWHYRGCESQEEKERELYLILKELAKDEDRLKEWNKIIESSAKMRLKLLQSKALGLLEKFSIPNNLSPSPAVAFCNLVLGDMLLARNERVKQMINPRAIPPGGEHAKSGDDVDDDLAMLLGEESKEDE